jgi:ribosomal protein S18 acetylase RimI-like enzyme
MEATGRILAEVQQEIGPWLRGAEASGGEIDRLRCMNVEVEIVREASQEIVDAFGRLLPQLSSSAKPLDREAADRMVACDANTVLVARAEGEIVGTLTLLLFPVPSGLRARIEDVVVDEAARGQGIAGAMTQEALRLAGEAGARTVDLTSRPARVAANRLYERLGFEARESTVYRLALRAPKRRPAAIARMRRMIAEGTADPSAGEER